MILIVLVVLGLSLFGPQALMAAEHGGTEMHEHGGKAVESHPHEAGNAAALKEAAALLKVAHPDLAAKLEKIAQEEEEE